jgi:hypothetical protein
MTKKLSVRDEAPAVSVGVDFACDETVQQVLSAIRKFRGRIVNFNPNGPAGGNPNIVLSFKTEKLALRFLRERYPDDDEAFLLSRITGAGARSANPLLLLIDARERAGERRKRARRP